MDLTIYLDGSQKRQAVKEELERLNLEHSTIPVSIKDRRYYPTLILEDGTWIWDTAYALDVLRELVEI